MIDPAYLDAVRAIARPIRAAAMPRSLEPVRRLLSELGNPQQQFASIVVTGSVGKGTACHQIAQILQQPGRDEIYLVPTKPNTNLPVGLYTGPHLHSFRERFIINGEPISQAEFVQAANAVFEAVSRLDFAYSTFEMATALALGWFARRGVATAVLEVGIGGRWDAVNAVENVLAVFTPIEREHIAMLGGSLQTIAWNKAGILKPRQSAVSTPQQPVVADVLRDEAALNEVALSFVEDDRLAWVAGDNLMTRSVIPARQFPEYLPPVRLPGRLEAVQIAGRTVLIDGGHTPASARHLLGEIWRLTNRQPVYLIVGMLRDKAIHEFLRVFDPYLFRITLTTAPGHRAFSPDELKQQANLQYTDAGIVPDLNDALLSVRDATESLVVITGSLRLAAAAREAFGLLTPDELAEARATRTIFEGEDYLSKLRRFG